jgi:transposase
MTWVGFDVHARSTSGAAIDVMSGELTRRRFGPGLDAPVPWLSELRGPVRACYEAGPTGYGLYRLAAAAGVGIEVVAPGKAPRGRSDRVKTDRKDAELLARLLMAGSLTPIAVPSPEVEAARELTRLHDVCRRDLMRARHRVAKMLLRHGRVYPSPTTWSVAHRRWLARQRFDDSRIEIAWGDLLAAVDALTARKAAVAQRLSEVALDDQWWPTVARLRAFRGIDTLTALSIDLELGADWERFTRPTALGAWLGPTPSLDQSGESHHIVMGRSPRQGRCSHADSRRVCLELRARAPRGSHAGQPPGRAAPAHPADLQPSPTAALSRTPQDARPRQASERHRRGGRTRAGVLFVGCCDRTLARPEHV